MSPRISITLGLLVASLAIPSTSEARSFADWVRKSPDEAMQAFVEHEQARGRPAEEARIRAATALANRLAPYGHSLAITWPALRTATQLDCDNYAAAAVYLYRRGGGRKAARWLGFDHGPFGNHAQIAIGPWLLDATIGIVADAPRLLEGVPARRIARVGRFRDAGPSTFAADVEYALRAGLYRPEHVIYDFWTRGSDLQAVAEGRVAYP